MTLGSARASLAVAGAPAGNSHCTSELLPKRRRRVFLDNVPAAAPRGACAPRTDRAARFIV